MKGKSNGQHKVCSPYTFTETVDLSVIGDYNLSVYTTLDGDFDKNNDTTTVLIENTLCQPQSL